MRRCFYVIFAVAVFSLSFATGPITRVTVERGDDKAVYNANQIPNAVADILAPTPTTPPVTPATPLPSDPAPVEVPAIPGVPVEPDVPVAGTWYVKTDAGFTSFPLAPGAREYFVSDSGNDGAAGTLAAPFRTIQKAAASCRDGSGDRVRPFAGSHFFGTVNWQISGKNGFFSGIIAYGDGQRPILATSGSGIVCSKGIKNVAFSGLLVTNTTRNPNLPATFVKKNPVEWAGIDIRNPGSQNIIIEDCKVEWYGNDILCHTTAAGKLHDTVTLNRNIVVDSWAPRTFGGQGFYADLIRHLVLTDNFFDHCGWIDAPNVGVTLVRTQFRHANYINKDATDIIATGNWFFRSASFGLQNRGGGVIQHNLFWDNGNHVNFYGHNGTFQYNVVIGGQPRADTDGTLAIAGASGVSAGSTQNLIDSNYFWGRPLAQMPTMKYPAAAIDINRRDEFTPAGNISWKLTNNGFVFWPIEPGQNTNLLRVGGQPVIPNMANNFMAKAPNPASVWPDQVWIDTLRNRPLHCWVTRNTPVQIYAAFQKANGK